eukprot:781538-Amphidinium_carterae.3
MHGWSFGLLHHRQAKIAEFNSWASIHQEVVLALCGFTCGTQRQALRPCANLAYTLRHVSIDGDLICAAALLRLDIPVQNTHCLQGMQRLHLATSSKIVTMQCPQHEAGT